MTQSINFIHNNNLITTQFDGKLFLKSNNAWGLTEGHLYKIEDRNPPSSLGNNGDYCAKYRKTSNNLLYSEDFTQDVWIKTNTTVSKEHVNFPFEDSMAFALKADETYDVHKMVYDVINKANCYQCFSFYAYKSDFESVKLSCYDKRGEGYQTIVNLANGSKTTSSIKTNTQMIFDNVTVTEHDMVVGEVVAHVYRISLTIKYPSLDLLHFAITLLNDDGEEEFSSIYKEGIFVNACHLSNTQYPEKYIKSTSSVVKSSDFVCLYTKNIGEWWETENNLYTVDYSKLVPSLGENGDIATCPSIVVLNPSIKIGDANNLASFYKNRGSVPSRSVVPTTGLKIGDTWHVMESITYQGITYSSYYLVYTGETSFTIKISKPDFGGDYTEGEMFYSEGSVYIVDKNNKPRKIPLYGKKTSHTKEMIHALTLNQNSYQTYTRHMESNNPGFGRGTNVTQGVNSGGCYYRFNAMRNFNPTSKR